MGEETTEKIRESTFQVRVCITCFFMEVIEKSNLSCIHVGKLRTAIKLSITRETILK